jgi:diadenosine tetraphosphatase ApaH/serine/threonine PP2A family protein phosphatase
VLEHGAQRCAASVTEEGDRIVLDTRRVILNPGSIGQPRDGDPRASYAILDTDAGTWEPHRVEYPVKTVQQRMRRRKLPRRLIARLTFGY